MQNHQTRIRLSNNVGIPCLGFGTWKTPAEQATASVLHALEAGYRHIDTATAYNNEAAVGTAIASSRIPREEIFLTSKLWNPHQGYQSTLDAFERSLERLQTAYLDLYLIHWPHDRKYFDNWQEMNRETWRAFEKLYRDGRIKAIGVSNFMIEHLEILKNHAKIMPMVNQVQLHPQHPQEEMVDYCKEHQIVPEAWSPLIQGQAFKRELLKEMAAKYDRTVAQICIRWIMQKGVIPLPKASSMERITGNADVFDFEIGEDDMEKIATLRTYGMIGEEPSIPRTRQVVGF